MLTPQQIQFIREYGNKELTEGCLIYCDSYEGEKYITIDKYNLHDATYSKYGIMLKTNYGGKTSYPFEILGHPVEWHHVFAKLRKEGNTITISPSSDGFDMLSFGKNHIPCDITLSPMDQPTLIAELLKLKQ